MASGAAVPGAEGLYVPLPDAGEPWRFAGPLDSLAIDAEDVEAFADGASEDRFDGPQGTTHFSFVARHSMSSI